MTQLGLSSSDVWVLSNLFSDTRTSPSVICIHVCRLIGADSVLTLPLSSYITRRRSAGLNECTHMFTPLQLCSSAAPHQHQESALLNVASHQVQIRNVKRLSCRRLQDARCQNLCSEAGL